jgi:RecA-family ATPase
MALTFEPVSYVIPGYICEGLTVLAGSPKLGKSWMTLAWALAVSSGRPAFGSIPVLLGDVLYLALEDNQRRLKKRLLHMGVTDAPERLTFHTDWPDLDNGCVLAVEQWLDAHSDARLIVVDVLAKVRGMAGKEWAYEADYKVLSGLQALAGRYGVAIVVVHHTRKMEADDPFDSVSGTRGLTGAADTGPNQPLYVEVGVAVPNVVLLICELTERIVFARQRIRCVLLVCVRATFRRRREWARRWGKVKAVSPRHVNKDDLAE